MCSPPEVYVVALYDFDYELDAGKKVSMREGEHFLLLKQTNADWWQVIRDGDKRSFYAPANYLEVVVQPVLVKRASAEDTHRPVLQRNGRKGSSLDGVLLLGSTDSNGNGLLEDEVPKAEEKKDNRQISAEEDRNRRNRQLVVPDTNRRLIRPPSPIYANFPLPPTSPTPPTPRDDEFPIRYLDGSSWAEFEDPQLTRRYYFNFQTKERSWKPPRRRSEAASNPEASSAESSKDSSPQAPPPCDVNLHSPTPDSPLMPPGWSREYDLDTQEVYYLNDLTKERWFTSADHCGRIYYYEENSAHSFWQLPEVVIAEQLDVGGSKKRLLPSTSSTSSLSECRRSPVASPPRSPPKSASPRLRPLSFAERGTKTRSMVLMDSRFVFAEKKGDHHQVPLLGCNVRSSTLPRSLASHHVTSIQRTLKQDLLYKTKLCDGGGKRTRKNWTPSFVLLTESSLFFYKDGRTAQIRHSPHCKPEFYLELGGASVDWAPDKSSRKNVFQVTTRSGVQILLQEENSQLCKSWHDAIADVIARLPPEPPGTTTAAACTFHLESSSPDGNKRKLTRAKSSKRIDTKGSGSSSTEELDAIPSERKMRIRDKLKNFFGRRPTMESLREKGILREEPVFGCHLATICAREPSGIGVPRFVQQCVVAIEEKDVKADGLYRASGNLSQVQRIRYQVNQENLAVLRAEEDVHVLTGTLKLFFRELKEPLFPFHMFEPFLAAVGLQDHVGKLEAFRKLVGQLPSPNYATLSFLLEHLLRVTRYSDWNRMHVQNLAIVFGPTLMWPATESVNLALDMMHQNQVIEFLLLEYDSLFR